MSPISVLSDVPAAADRDQLGFDRYLTPLVEILTDTRTETPFTIGIFGAWGSGKSTLLAMLDNRLAREHAGAFVSVQFNPWLHRNEPNMLVPLLHALHDALDGDPAHRFIDSAKKIGEVLLRLGADVLLRGFTADRASLENLEKLEETYLKERGRVRSEMRSLRTTLQLEADAIFHKGAKLIIFIDDLDRCEPSDIVGVLEATKLFLDLRHTFVIIAVDKEVIDRGIDFKYSNFKFATDRAAAIGAEYLEKIVQLPLYLFPLHLTQVRRFLEALAPPASVRDQLDLLEKLVIPSPRKIKRIVNMLVVTSAIIEGSGLDMGLVVRLLVLQVQAGELYARITKHSDLLLALDEVFAKERNVDRLQDFEAFGSRREAVQAFCKEFYRPESHFAPVFEGSPFKRGSGKLPIYLSMLGG